MRNVTLGETDCTRGRQLCGHHCNLVMANMLLDGLVNHVGFPLRILEDVGPDPVDPNHSGVSVPSLMILELIQPLPLRSSIVSYRDFPATG